MDAYRTAHEHRLEWMPWLWDSLTERQASWARPWQLQVQAAIAAVERVEFGDDVFVAPSAHLFAEPGRDIVVGAGSRIGAESFLHGPVRIGERVSINPRCHLEGGGGITIGADTRIATGVRIFGFDHGTAAGVPIRVQPVRTRGVRIGTDCWIGAGAGIIDGVNVGEGAVVGLGAVVTRDVAPGTIVAGVPARPIGVRG